jgi:uncharacterized protein YjiS (DUF1127 family)
MTTHDTQFAAAAALYRIAAATLAGAYRLRDAARSLDAWLARRRAARVAQDDFATMSERDLRDIGLSRADVPGIAWGASERARDAF